MPQARTSQHRPRRGRKPPGPVLLTATSAADSKHLRRIAEAQARLAGMPAPEVRVFRFRHQLAPVGWLAMMAGGLVAMPLGVSPLVVVAGAAVTVAVTVAAIRHWPKFTRVHAQFSAGWAAVWAVMLMQAGAGW